MALATGARHGLGFERHHLQIVRKPAAGLDGVKPGGQHRVLGGDARGVAVGQDFDDVGADDVGSLEGAEEVQRLAAGEAARAGRAGAWGEGGIDDVDVKVVKVEDDLDEKLEAVRDTGEIAPRALPPGVGG